MSRVADMPQQPPTPQLSPIAAASSAIELVKRRLFPFRFERWLVLGVGAFLDTCGRGAGSGGLQVPLRGSSAGRSSNDWTAAGAFDWFFEHAGMIALVGAAVMLLILALLAVALWISSRGTFIYIDQVATDRVEIARPWSEHAVSAWSYFRWSFGLAVASLVGLLVAFGVGGWLLYSTVVGGLGGIGIAGIVAVVGLLVAFLLTMGLVGMVLRDFAAPLQLARGIPAGEAMRASWQLIAANPLPFLGYLGLKIVFSLVFAFAAVLGGCLTCCLGFLPVLSHTLLQPLHYFGRAWSLALLRQAGEIPFPEPASPAPR